MIDIDGIDVIKKEGYYIVGATARTLDGLRDVVPIDMFNYIIINNGVSIYNPEEDTDEWMGFLEQQEAEKIIKRYLKPIF